MSGTSSSIAAGQPHVDCVITPVFGKNDYFNEVNPVRNDGRELFFVDVGPNSDTTMRSLGDLRD